MPKGYSKKRTPAKQKKINKKISATMTRDRKEIITKLKDAAKIGSTAREQQFYAEISHRLYYDILKENPELGETLEQLRDKPKFQARMNVAKNLNTGDIYTSRWYLEKTDDEMKTNKHEVTMPDPEEDDDDAKAEYERKRQAIKEAKREYIHKMANQDETNKKKSKNNK